MTAPQPERWQGQLSGSFPPFPPPYARQHRALPTFHAAGDILPGVASEQDLFFCEHALVGVGRCVLHLSVHRGESCVASHFRNPCLGFGGVPLPLTLTQPCAAVSSLLVCTKLCFFFFYPSPSFLKMWFPEYRTTQDCCETFLIKPLPPCSS